MYRHSERGWGERWKLVLVGQRLHYPKQGGPSRRIGLEAWRSRHKLDRVPEVGEKKWRWWYHSFWRKSVYFVCFMCIRNFRTCLDKRKNKYNVRLCAQATSADPRTPCGTHGKVNISFVLCVFVLVQHMYNIEKNITLDCVQKQRRRTRDFRADDLKKLYFVGFMCIRICLYICWKANKRV